MLSQEFRSLIAPHARTLNIIWLAFLVAPAIYLVMAWFLTRQPKAVAATVDPVLLQALMGVVGLGLAAGSFAYRKRALGRPVLERRLQAGPPSTVGASGREQAGLVAMMAGTSSLADSEKRLAWLFPHYQTTMIIACAMREALAVFGLVLTIITGSFVQMVPWAAAAMVLILAQPPRPASFLEETLPVARGLG